MSWKDLHVNKHSFNSIMPNFRGFAIFQNFAETIFADSVNVTPNVIAKKNYAQNFRGWRSIHEKRKKIFAPHKFCAIRYVICKA